MVGRGKHLKEPEVKDDLMMTGMPKPLVARHGGPRVKLSPWPFCGWVPRPTKAIWMTLTSKECKWCNILPVGLGGSTHKKFIKQR